MAVIAIIIGALLFSYLISAVYAKLWYKNLEVTVDFTEDAVVEGMDSALTETIINRKWLFLPMLQVGFQTHRNLKFANDENVSVSDLCYKRDIFSVGSYQKITRTVPFQCSKRGYYEIDSTQLITRSPLMTTKWHETKAQNTGFYVYPKLMDDAFLEISFQKIMGEVFSKKSTYEDPFEFRGLREYQPADPMNKINWKASARSNQWMVNLYGSTNAREITILLDVEDEGVLKYDDIHEKQIRLAASLAAHFIEAGIVVSLVTNGKDIKEDKVLKLAAGTGKQQLTNINRALSRIDLKKDPEVMALTLEKERKSLSHSQKTFILISKNQRMDCYEGFLNLIEQGAAGFWIST